MNLRCKQGDLAISIRGRNAGLIVKCLSFVGCPPLPGLLSTPENDCWKVDRDIPWRTKSGEILTKSPFITDRVLFPLRGLSADEVAEIKREAEREVVK